MPCQVFKGKAIEKLLSPAGLKVIATQIGKTAPTKKEIGRFFQEKYAQEQPIEFDHETVAGVRTLLDECEARLK